MIHATHEAVRKAGGIGTVLEGLMTSSVYQKAVRRSFLVGPLSRLEDEDLLAESGEVLFSTISGVEDVDCADALNRVAERYNVNIVYGMRRFTGGYEADVVLVDAGDVNPRRSRNFKYNLYRHFGLTSDRYDAVADYALYIDGAEAIYDAVIALIGRFRGRILCWRMSIWACLSRSRRLWKMIRAFGRFFTPMRFRRCGGSQRTTRGTM